MDLKDFYYELPEELIAQTPLRERSSSRLMTVDKKTGELRHRIFSDITDIIKPGDCLVINDTKVLPARLIGEKKTGARIELLLLKRRSDTQWETLVNPGKKARPGDVVIFGDGRLTAVIDEVCEGGNRLVTFNFSGIFEEILDALGEMPLPPYIKERLEDKDRYQTVYAKEKGSAAAPTAGLHFTPRLLEELSRKGVHIARLTLHVGLGTFRPVKVNDIGKHVMHSEYYHIESEQADIVNRAKANGGKVIAVGTTSCRTLETCADANGVLHAGAGDTSIFIYPGYKFKITDALITNFHLPESTLLMLVSAMVGRENILAAYAEAVRERYRFFSFGDAMLIL